MGRRLTIVGTPARLPWWAAAASIRLPRTEPRSATIADSPRVSPNPKPPTPMSSVPAARTSSPIPRLDQRTNRSKVRRTRNPGGTGSTPHSGGLRTRNIGRPSPPRIYRIGGRPAALHLFLFADFFYECFHPVTSGGSFSPRQLMRAPPPRLPRLILFRGP